MTPVTEPDIVRPADALSAVALKYGVTVAAIKGPARSKWISTARKAVCLRLRELGLSVTEIGLMLDRNHTTICYLTDSRKKAR